MLEVEKLFGNVMFLKNHERVESKVKRLILNRNRNRRKKGKDEYRWRFIELVAGNSKNTSLMAS